MRTPQIVACSILLMQIFYSQASTVADTQLEQLATEIERVHQLESTGNTDDAIKEYELLISRYPQQAELYNNLAVLLAQTGKLDAARERLEQAMQINQVYATVYENLTAVYVEMARGSYAKALQLGVMPQQVSLKEVEMNIALAQKADTATNSQDKIEVSAVADDLPAPSVRASKQNEDIRLTLQGWASAWSAQEVDLYFSFYASEFKPGKGISRSHWQKQRSIRLRRPSWVKVVINDFKVQPTEQGLARVRFLQHYQSDNYRDETRKEILLKPSAEGWRILSERSL